MQATERVFLWPFRCDSECKNKLVCHVIGNQKGEILIFTEFSAQSKAQSLHTCMCGERNRLQEDESECGTKMKEKNHSPN